MDWIDQKIEQIQIRFKKMSLKSTLICYILLAAVGVIALTLVTVSIMIGWEQLIQLRYQGHDTYFYEGKWVIDGIKLSDQILINGIMLMQRWCPLCYSLLAVYILVRLFFKNRMEVPMELLKEEAAYISRNDLSFECRYDSGDEMGELCRFFDDMRLQMIENQKATWKLMEEQRKLNAAFAHDLRTPLTVLRGYTDYLVQFYPQGKVTESQLCDKLKVMNDQVLRLMNFSSTMKEITTIEEIEVRRKRIPYKQLEKNILGMIDALNGLGGIELSLLSGLKEGGSCYLDEQIFMEVLENIVSNAMRYANTKIQISMESSEEETHLLVYVQDDGKGFTKEGLKMADRPYYRDKQGKEGEHFGLGLFICSMLCGKHGGVLGMSNSIDGGAITEVSFYVK